MKKHKMMIHKIKQKKLSIKVKTNNPIINKYTYITFKINYLINFHTLNILHHLTILLV